MKKSPFVQPETDAERKARHQVTREKNRKERIARKKAEEEKAAKEGRAPRPLPPVEIHFEDPTVGILAVANTERRIRRMGNPPIYETPEQMAPVITEFFDYCIATQTPPLITTLVLALGFAQRHTLDVYMKKPEFTDIIKRAKLVCEDYAAKGLIMGKNTIGFIFLLKQYGWKDVQENITTYETHEQRIARLINQNSGG